MEEQEKQTPENEWNQLLKKLSKAPVPLKIETHLLAVTLPERDWVQLTRDGKPDYLTEAQTAAWTLGSYVDRHTSISEMLTVGYSKDDKVAPEISALMIMLFSILNNFSVDCLGKIPMDVLHFCRLIGLQLLKRKEFTDSEYLKKLVEIVDEILIKRYEIITTIVEKNININFGIENE